MAEWLGCGWSPLLISGRLRVLFPDDSAMRVCPETVYRWICADRHRRERWARCLPRGHRRRRRRDGGRTSRFPIPGVPIPERPSEAGDRSGFGHWEADGVIGAGCDLHTEVERKTRFLMAGIMAGELREIVDEADNRPMRVLGYRTPAEAFADELLELQDQQGCCTSK